MAGQLQIEEKLETGLITLLEANSYISGNSVTVRNWHDASQARISELVVVHSLPVVNEFSNATSSLFMCDVEIHAVTYSADDTDLAALKDIYQACLYTIQNTTAAALGTAASITVNGITLIENGEEFINVSDAYQALICKVQCHIQI